MRWLIALGLVVAACSGSGSDGASSFAGEGGEAGAGAAPSGGSAAKAGGSARAGAPAHAGEGDAAGGSGGVNGEPTSGGAAGSGLDPVAGQGGGEPFTAGGGAGGSGVTAGAGAGGDSPDPEPDPCDGVPAWDPAVPYTELVKDELRTLRGQLWKCSSPAFCTTHPGHETAPGWVKVDECASPTEGGEPACQCEEGACCDGCYFRPRSHFCGEVVRFAECAGNVVPACGGRLEDVRLDYWNLFCGGDTGGDCERWGAHTKDTLSDCGQQSGCVESGNQAACVPCSN
jgi:hypothetical protein